MYKDERVEVLESEYKSDKNKETRKKRAHRTHKCAYTREREGGGAVSGYGESRITPNTQITELLYRK